MAISTSSCSFECFTFLLTYLCACVQQLSDVTAIAQLLAPLEEAGICRHRSRSELASDIRMFTVVERESKVAWVQSMFI